MIIRRVIAVLIFAMLIAPISRGQSRRVGAEPDARLVVTMPEETSLDADGTARALPTWRKMIGDAKRSIDIAQFYFASQPGKAIETIIADLEAAGKRGIRIRFLVSEALLDQDTSTMMKLKSVPGLTLRVLDLKHRTGGELHAKYWIIDDEIIFVGSQNFDWRSLTQIQELGVLITDQSMARQLGRIYEADWKMAAVAADTKHRNAGRRASTGNSGRAKSGDIELVASPPSLNPSGIRAALPALLELIRDADSSISIELLSYNTVADRKNYWPEIDAALRTAAVRGVKVKLMVSHWNTSAPGIDHLKSLSLIPNIEVRIVTIPEHSTGFIPYARVIHSKFMVVDNRTLWLGTSNWSRDYFEKQRNVELIISRRSLAIEAAGLFDLTWNSAYAAPVDVTRKYPRPKRG